MAWTFQGEKTLCDKGTAVARRKQWKQGETNGFPGSTEEVEGSSPMADPAESQASGKEVKASYLLHGSRTRWGLSSRHTHWGDEGGGRLGGRNGWMDLVVGHRTNGKSARKNEKR